MAGLLSVLFRGTDLVPSDLLAGSILQRVRQKRESRELKHIRRIQIDDTPRYSTDLSKVFATTPSWMNLKSAHHFLRFALASYGWPMVCYIKCCAGGLQLIKKSTCCPCFRFVFRNVKRDCNFHLQFPSIFRSKSQNIHNDNCCLCHTAGVRYMSRLKNEDILFASFKNQVFEVSFSAVIFKNSIITKYKIQK